MNKSIRGQSFANESQFIESLDFRELCRWADLFARNKLNNVCVVCVIVVTPMFVLKFSRAPSASVNLHFCHYHLTRATRFVGRRRVGVSSACVIVVRPHIMYHTSLSLSSAAVVQWAHRYAFATRWPMHTQFSSSTYRNHHKTDAPTQLAYCVQLSLSFIHTFAVGKASSFSTLCSHKQFN